MLHIQLKCWDPKAFIIVPDAVRIPDELNKEQKMYKTKFEEKERLIDISAFVCYAILSAF